MKDIIGDDKPLSAPTYFELPEPVSPKPGLHERLVPLSARIALAHYGNMLKIMTFNMFDETCMYYLRYYQEDFIEVGKQNPPQANEITIEWLEERWPI